MEPTLLDAARQADVWVFDVDATLVDGMSATSLRPGAKELLSTLRTAGRRVMAWSAGGEDYARRRLTDTGIIDLLDAVHEKGERGADRCYDPTPILIGRSATTAVFVDDQPVDLSPRLTVLAVRPYLAANPHDAELIRISADLGTLDNPGTLDVTRGVLRKRWYAEGFFGTKTLSDCMRDGAAAFPHAKAVFHSAEHPDEADLGTLYQRGNALARGLAAIGFRAGDVLAVQVPNWLEGSVTYAAAMRLGLTIVPIVHIYGSSEVGFILRASKAKGLIVPTRWRSIDYRDRVRALGDVPDLEHVIWIGDGAPHTGVQWSSLESGGDTPLPESNASPDDPCLLIYTSGTTAEPKGVLHSHNTLIAEISSMREVLGTGPHSITLAAFPAGHIAGVLNVLRTFLCGTSSVLMDQWDPAVGAELVERYGCTSTSGAPFHLTSLIEAGRRDGRDLSSLEGYMVGAASVPPALVTEAEIHGIQAYRAYGSSEHPVVTTGVPSDPAEKRSTTDGRLTPGNEVRIVDDDDRDVPVGADGEILLRGPEQFLRYQNPDHDRDAFVMPGAWFRSGDIGRLDADGYLTITDRKKDVIIRGGENIASKEVEDLLARHPAVLESAAIGRPDPRYGERVMVFVLLRPDAASTLAGGAFDLAEVQRHFARLGVAKQKTPEFVEVVNELPRGMSGKVKKFELRALVKAEGRST